ncbi:uncharacterized protein LOC110043995 isoform X2 [Orbicella faveolata]|uniref:uncharacterized protein LOC110043995 isoform X2 n=1 Tax=Orbicella faveolata TaxID=48498 RepID=UPI0009E27768|nr:uncharacterized protein LOC110043995 isoform X2 [Orbicella faveolata]
MSVCHLVFPAFFATQSPTLLQRSNPYPVPRKNKMAVHLGGNFGYVFSVEEANKLIEDLEIQSTAKFACCKATKDFGSVDYTKGPHRIFWEDSQFVDGAKISFNGVPFIILGSKVYDCQHGVDRNTALKRKRREEAETEVNVVKKRRNTQSKQKLNCPAKIKLRDILAFPRFKEDGMCQRVDKRIINRIHELVAEGLTNTNQVKHQLEFFVKNVLFKDKELPQPTNRRFYPTANDIRSHILRGKLKNRDSSQETSIPVDQPSSASETLNTSLDELPIEVIADDMNVLPDDTNTIPSETNTIPDDTNTILDDTNTIPDDTNTIPNDINVALSSADAGEKCRDLLEQLRQLTFATQDEEVLANLNNRLQQLLRDMQLVCCVRQFGDHDYVVHENNSSLQRET